MLVTMFGKKSPVEPPATPACRGYLVVYRANEVNHCPGCGRTHWYVGRLSAECGFCSTAIPLADTGTCGVGLVRQHGARRSRLATAA